MVWKGLGFCKIESKETKHTSTVVGSESGCRNLLRGVGHKKSAIHSCSNDIVLKENQTWKRNYQYEIK